MLNYAARRGKKQDLAAFIERLSIHSNGLKDYEVTKSVTKSGS